MIDSKSSESHFFFAIPTTLKIQHPVFRAKNQTESSGNSGIQNIQMTQLLLRYSLQAGWRCGCRIDFPVDGYGGYFTRIFLPPLM